MKITIEIHTLAEALAVVNALASVPVVMAPVQTFSPSPINLTEPPVEHVASVLDEKPRKGRPPKFGAAAKAETAKPFDRDGAIKTLRAKVANDYDKLEAWLTDNKCETFLELDDANLARALTELA